MLPSQGQELADDALTSAQGNVGNHWVLLALVSVAPMCEFKEAPPLDRLIEKRGPFCVDMFWQSNGGWISAHLFTCLHQMTVQSTS